MSARNRELIALIPVALLVTAGFTAVFIVESNQLGNLSLLYGGYFLALCVVAHIVIRIRLPDADPYLFPLVALLAAFGLVMIYRIDDGLARDQANWFVLGLVLFAATIVFLRDYEALERYRYVIATIGLGLLLLPRVPGIGAQVNGAYLGIKIGPISFQPAEFAKICIVVFLASYLREHREVLIVGARRVAGGHAAAAQALRPAARRLGRVDVHARLHPRPGQLADVLRRLPRPALRRHRPSSRSSSIGMLLFVGGAWFFAHTVAHVHERVDIWLDPFKHAGGSGYQVAQSLFAQADGGLFGQGFGRRCWNCRAAARSCRRRTPT